MHRETDNDYNNRAHFPAQLVIRLYVYFFLDLTKKLYKLSTRYPL